MGYIKKEPQKEYIMMWNSNKIWYRFKPSLFCVLILVSLSKAVGMQQGLSHKNDFWRLGRSRKTRQKEPAPLVRVSCTTFQLDGNSNLFFYEKP
ncbi:MAG: hypothetical protein ACJAWV_003519 [Flammeovirgaceae bacterium]|jgi:hypothetical protein